MGPRKAVGVLERRREFLQARVDRGGYSPTALEWASEEIAALDVAIPLLQHEADLFDATRDRNRALYGVHIIPAAAP